MAQNKYALARYYLIDSLLRKFKYVKTLAMAEYCKEKTGYTISQRTIQMDIEAMKNDSFLGFYAPIKYCNRRKAYYYIQPDYMLAPFSIKRSEIKVLEELLDHVDSKKEDEQYFLAKRIIQRMKVFAVE